MSMVKEIGRIEEYEASQIGIRIAPEGNAVLTVSTERGDVVIHIRQRNLLQRLASRITRELERVPPPSRRQKDA
jgi:hypothetical protein